MCFINWTKFQIAKSPSGKNKIEFDLTKIVFFEYIPWKHLNFVRFYLKLEIKL